MINSKFYCPILHIMFKFTWVTANARRSKYTCVSCQKFVIRKDHYYFFEKNGRLVNKSKLTYKYGLMNKPKIYSIIKIPQSFLSVRLRGSTIIMSRCLITAGLALSLPLRNIISFLPSVYQWCARKNHRCYWIFVHNWLGL